MNFHYYCIKFGITISLAAGVYAPLPMFLIEYDAPVFLTWYGPQRVLALFKYFSINGKVFGCFKSSGLVGPGPPHFAIGHESPKNFSSLFIRSIIEYGNLQITLVEGNRFFRAKRLGLLLHVNHSNPSE